MSRSLFITTVIILLFLQNSIMAIETPNFKLIKKEGEFEIREYEPMIIAMTKVKSGYREASNTGFRRIANYLGEVRTELKRVNWPSYSTLSSFTIVTVVTIAFFTFFIFGMDFSFKNTLINLLSFGE